MRILLGVMALAILGLGGCGGNSGSNNVPSGTVSPAATVTITIPSGSTGMGPAAYGTNPLHVPI